MVQVADWRFQRERRSPETGLCCLRHSRDRDPATLTPDLGRSQRPLSEGLGQTPANQLVSNAPVSGTNAPLPTLRQMSGGEPALTRTSCWSREAFAPARA